MASINKLTKGLIVKKPKKKKRVYMDMDSECEQESEEAENSLEERLVLKVDAT